MRVLDLKKIAIFLLVLVSGNNLFAMELSKSKRSNPIAEQYMIKSENVFQAYPDSGRYYAKKSLSYSENSLDSAYAFQQLGRSFVELGFIDSGFVCLNNARKIFNDNNITAGLVRVYTDLGQAFLQFKYLEKAKEYYLKALSLKAIELNEDMLLMDIYYHIGVIESQLGNFKGSFTYFDKLLIYYKNHEQKTHYLNTIIEYAKALTNFGNYEKSSQILLSSIPKGGDKIVLIYSQLALNSHYEASIEKAIYYSELELESSRNLADSLECLNNLNAYLIQNGEYDKASSYYYLITSHHFSPHKLVHISLNQIEAFVYQKQYNEAKGLFIQTFETIVDYKMSDYYRNLINIKNVLEKNGIIKGIDVDQIIFNILEDNKLNNNCGKEISKSLIKTIALADQEIESKDKEIELKNKYNMALATLTILLIFSLTLIFYKHHKLKLYLNSLQESYKIVSDKVNNDLRMLLQKLLLIEEEIGSVFSIRKRVDKDILPLLDDIKRLLEVLSKQLFKSTNKSQEK